MTLNPVDVLQFHACEETKVSGGGSRCVDSCHMAMTFRFVVSTHATAKTWTTGLVVVLVERSHRGDTDRDVTPKLCCTVCCVVWIFMQTFKCQGRLVCTLCKSDGPEGRQTFWALDVSASSSGHTEDEILCEEWNFL